MDSRYIDILIGIEEKKSQFQHYASIFFCFVKFQCNSTDFHILHHSQTQFVMKITYDIKISQILLFKIVEFTHISFKFGLHVNL